MRSLAEFDAIKGFFRCVIDKLIEMDLQFHLEVWYTVIQCKRKLREWQWPSEYQDHAPPLSSIHVGAVKFKLFRGF